MEGGLRGKREKAKKIKGKRVKANKLKGKKERRFKREEGPFQMQCTLTRLLSVHGPIGS